MSWVPIHANLFLFHIPISKFPWDNMDDNPTLLLCDLYSHDTIFFCFDFGML